MMGQAFGAAHRISTKLFAPEKANELESVPHEDFQISSPRLNYMCEKPSRYEVLEEKFSENMAGAVPAHKQR